MATWGPAFLEIDLDAVDQPDSPAFQEFRRVVPETQISTAALLALGARSRSKGVATTVREIPVLLANGRTVMILPPAGEDRYLLEYIARPVSPPTAVLVNQGLNSCWLDVTLFLSASFNLGRQRRDAQTLGSLRTSTRTQIAFQYVMNHLFQCTGDKSAQLQHNNRLRDVLLDILAEAVSYTHLTLPTKRIV